MEIIQFDHPYNNEEEKDPFNDIMSVKSGKTAKSVTRKPKSTKAEAETDE